jgi:seryl-tRNA synthetase
MEVVMLDLKFVRENPEVVKQNIRNKFQDNKLPLVDEVIALDVENRNTKQEADNLRFERNKISNRSVLLWHRVKKPRLKR